MKKKDFSELKNKSIGNLNQMLASLAKESLEKKLQGSQTKIKNVHLQKQIRKDIARIKTLIRIKQFEESTKGHK